MECIEDVFSSSSTTCIRQRKSFSRLNVLVHKCRMYYLRPKFVNNLIKMSNQSHELKKHPIEILSLVFLIFLGKLYIFTHHLVFYCGYWILNPYKLYDLLSAYF